eukprot:PhM_4_TR12054/c0_g1_i1/m.2338/K06628/CDC45; cell division control protein 45
MVTFVTAEYYLSAYDCIRKAFRATRVPVQVFCNVSIDTCTSTCVLLHLLEADLVRFDVHPVHTTDDIFSVLRSHDLFDDEENVQCVFVNCGSTISLADALNLDRCHTHVLDSHGPVHLENLLCPSQTLFLWDGGSLRSGIESYFRHAGKRRREDGDADGNDDDESQQVDEDFMWESLAELTPEAERRYYLSHLKGSSASKMLFDVAVALRTTVEDEMLWFRSVALAGDLLHNNIGATEYATEMFGVHHAVNVAGMGKNKHRKAMHEVNTNIGAEESVPVAVGAYHQIHVENVLSRRLVLLQLSCLWEATVHCPDLSHRLGLLRSDSVGQDRLKELLAHAGITMREANTRWFDIPTKRRDEMLRVFCEEAEKRYGLRDFTFRTVAKRCGFGLSLTAADMVHALDALLGTGDSASEGFLRCIDVLRSRDAQSPADAALDFTRSVYRQACALIQKNAVTSLKSFHYVFLSEEDVPRWYLTPTTLRALAGYLLPTLSRTPKERPRPLLVGALDSTTDRYVIVGCNAVDPRTGSKSSRSMGPHFARAAERYPALVGHHGIDADWMTLQRAHAVLVLEAIHLDMISAKMPTGRRAELQPSPLSSV